ncbi:MAG: hypothetical protein PVG61_00570 [Dehalococcoidia bacterium]|jgi:hypothetical protein
MPDRQYEKYILEELRQPEGGRERDEEHGYSNRATRVLWLEDEIMKGSTSIICSWYWKAEEMGTPAHTHDFDEILGFIGNDHNNPSDLGGEVELWLEDEIYLLKKSCFVLCPAGLRHCPLKIKRVDRPFLFLAFSITGKYIKDNINLDIH